MAYPHKVNKRRTTTPRKVAGELALLRSLRDRAHRSHPAGLSLGIGDDCALLRLRDGEEAAVTTDLSIEGRHFRLDWHSPESVGHRALARGLSDLAAMGARPVAAFLSLGLPRTLTVKHRGHSWADRFLDGLLALAAQYKTPLAGGDLAEAPLAMADIVLVGAVPQGKALLRSGAKAGDLLYVTGAVGGSGAGLKKLREWAEISAEKDAAKGRQVARTEPRPWPQKLRPLVKAHLFPQPRIAAGLRLRPLASAALDISDGLSTDLRHLCEESRVCAEVEADSLPLGPGATLADALHGGEDYEVLFTASPATRIPRFMQGIPITPIGRMQRLRPGKPLITLRSNGRSEPLTGAGWEHFS